MVLHPQSSPTGHITTTILINNIHYASCLFYIQEVLNTLPLSTIANYLSHEVTIIYFPEFSVNGIFRALLDAVFEVQNTRTEDEFGNNIYEQNTAQAPPEWLEQAAETLSGQASALLWRQTTIYPRLLNNTNHYFNKKHIEYYIIYQKSNKKIEISIDIIIIISEA
jgi:hypothetical protein